MKIESRLSTADVAFVRAATLERREVLERPISRKRLGPALTTLLWALRLYVLAAIPLVVYAFTRALHAS